MVVKITEKIKFHIPVEQGIARKVALITVAVLCTMALVLGVTCTVLFFRTDRLTVEAGSTVTAEMLTGDADAYFGADFDPECVNVAGVYYFTVYVGGEARQARLEVVDTKAPEVAIKRIKWPVGGARRPAAEDFVGEVYEAGSFVGYFVEDLPEFEKRMGEYKAKVQFEDAVGNKTRVFEVYLDLVSDNERPVVDLMVDGVVVEIGYDPETAEKSIYDGIASVSDNCAGDLRVEIDDSGVNYNKKGRYTAYVYGYDMIGNKSDKVALTVEVVETSQEK